MEVRTDEPLNNGEHEVDACIDVLHKGAVLIERRVNKEGEREGSDRTEGPHQTSVILDQRTDEVIGSSLV